MARNRVIYNVQDVYVGPSNPSGYTLIANSNVVQRLERVKTLNWNIVPERVSVRELGSYGNVAEPILSEARVEFNFDYCLANIGNEAKIGLGVNYDTGNKPIFTDNYAINILSGFMAPSGIGDKRNFYVAINRSEDDIHASVAIPTTSGQTFEQVIINPASTGWTVLTLQNSYLRSYNQEAQVGDFIKCSVSYVAENIIVNSSGSGLAVPILNPRNGTNYSTDLRVVFPNTYIENQPSVLLPGDITIDINPNLTYNETGTLPQKPGTTGIVDLAVDISDAKISAYKFDLNLDREQAKFIGYRFPLDQPIKYPVIGNLTFDMLVGDSQTGSFVNLFTNDSEYDLAIKIRNPLRSPTTGQTNAYRLDLRNAMFNGLTMSDSIGSNKRATLNFKVQSIPNSYRTGIFMSGIAHYENMEGYLLTESGEFLLTESGEKVMLEPILWGPTTF
jgi:hypothetical protein